MARGPIYKVKLRRRRQGKTDFYQRRELLKSGSIRLVIRRSTKHMRLQFVEAQPDGDITLANCSSTLLQNYGWTLGGGNIPAAYLTGYITGLIAKKKGVDNAILDLGLQRNSKGSRIYAALKGIVDAGVQVPVNEEIFPIDEVIHGSHMKNISSNIQDLDTKQFKIRFAKYTKAKVKPGDISKLVDKSIKAIDKAFQEVN